MSIIYSKGIGLSTVSATAYIDLSRKASSDAPSPTVPDGGPVSEYQPFVKWGDDNLEPQRLVADIGKCGVLNAGIDGKARFAIGKGIVPMKLIGHKPDGSEILEPVLKNYEIEDFLEASDDYFQSFAWFKDQLALGKLDARFVLQRNREKVAYVQREDPCTVRLSHAEGKGRNLGKIMKSYLSYQWDSVSSYDKSSSKVIEFPLIPAINSSAWLQEQMKESKNLEYFYSTFYPSWNRRYYPKPLWTAAYDWVRVSQSIPAMKSAMFNNNVRVKTMVVVDEKYWERNYSNWNDEAIFTDEKKEEARTELFNDIESYLTGNENAYKTVFVNGGFNPQTQKEWQDIKILPIDDKTKDGELLPDSAAANSEILFAIMMNPAIIGVQSPGGSLGAGSGSDIREATLVQVMIQEFERRQIAKIFRIVQRVNGWDRDIVFRFPGLILTTLDTGGSTKQVA